LGQPPNSSKQAVLVAIEEEIVKELITGKKLPTVGMTIIPYEDCPNLVSQ